MDFPGILLGTLIGLGVTAFLGILLTIVGAPAALIVLRRRRKYYLLFFATIYGLVRIAGEPWGALSILAFAEYFVQAVIVLFVGGALATWLWNRPPVVRLVERLKTDERSNK